MIPADLTPRWRDLPVLAWLAAGGFRAGTPSTALVTVVARAAVWPAFLQVFTGARAEHRLAAHRRAVVAIVTVLPARRRWHGYGASLMVLPLAVAALIAPAVVLAGLGIVVSVAGGHLVGHVLLLLAPFAFVVLAALAIAAVGPELRAGTRRELAVARRLAGHQHSRLAEASTLAADPASTWACTVFVRRLLHAADDQQVAVLAYARDDRLAELYHRLGFRPIVPGAHRAVCRAPRRAGQVPACEKPRTVRGG
jgi:hypothetical protein